MLKSTFATVVQAGARLATLASLLLEEAIPLALHVVQGGQPERLGAAEVFATNLRAAQVRVPCEEALMRLFDDEDAAVRREAASCFSTFERDELGTASDLIVAFLQSRAFGEDHSHLIRALETSTARMPGLTADVCARFLDRFTDPQQSRTLDNEASAIARLLVRAYQQSGDAASQTRCLELIDRLTELEAYGLEAVLAQVDR